MNFSPRDKSNNSSPPLLPSIKNLLEIARDGEWGRRGAPVRAGFRNPELEPEPWSVAGSRFLGWSGSGVPSPRAFESRLGLDPALADPGLPVNSSGKSHGWPPSEWRARATRRFWKRDSCRSVSFPPSRNTLLLVSTLARLRLASLEERACRFKGTPFLEKKEFVSTLFDPESSTDFKIPRIFGIFRGDDFRGLDKSRRVIIRAMIDSFLVVPSRDDWWK